MITRKFLNIYGLVGVFLMGVALVLIWFRLVPSELYLPLFVIAFAIWLSRLIMRLILVRKERREEVGEHQPSKTGH